MKKFNWTYAKLVAVLAIVLILFAFAGERHSNRKLQNVTVSYTEYNDLLITEDSVNKMLIQSNDSVQNILPETLDLNELESRLEANEMVDNAEVFYAVDGEMGAVITQRQPIARIAGNRVQYLDNGNLIMPLSNVTSVRVPLVSGYESVDKEAFFEMVNFVRSDEQLNTLVTDYKITSNGSVKLRLRDMEFWIIYGKPVDFEKRFGNLKVFLTKAIRDKVINDFISVDLRFSGQVVCTKK